MNVAYGRGQDVFHSRQKVTEVQKKGRNKITFLNVSFKSRQGASDQNTKDVFDVQSVQNLSGAIYVGFILLLIQILSVKAFHTYLTISTLR